MSFTTRPELRGTFGMVASTHWLASAAGMAVLERGGNAFDAAVAAGFVLQVVEPHLSGPGGEAPIVAHSARGGKTFVVNGQGPAPRAATIAAFDELGMKLVPGTGLLPACVPGAFGAWLLLLRDFGTMELRDVMSYALAYAANGYPLVPQIVATIASVERLFRERWTDSAAIYLPHGSLPVPGSLLTNPPLAATYERILAEADGSSGGRDERIETARRVFYEGFVAEQIGAFVKTAEVVDATGERHAGFLTADDMAAYAARVEEPARFDYRGFTVCKTGSWGQGPVFLQQLALLDGFDLEAMGYGSADFVHTVVECAKLAFADREAYYGDPDFANVPMVALLHPSYSDKRRMLVAESASVELRSGRVGPPARVPFATPSEWTLLQEDLDPGAGEPTMGPPDGDTCHVDVVDRFGNFVSATPSGGWLQSSPVIPDLGFPLGTRAQMFWLVPDHPNSLEGGKRPRTTLSPSFVLRDGAPYLAFGTPGGDQQDQWTLNFFLAHALFGMNLQEAIDAPTFHTTHFPSSFYPRTSHPGQIVVEDRVGDAVLAELRRRGHEVVVADGWSLGRVSAAGRDVDGTLKAAANPRGMQGYAAGR